MIRELFRYIKLSRFQKRWRKNNSHNDTHAVNIFNCHNVTVGKMTYGPVEVLYYSGRGRLTIGNYCSIAREVKFFLGGGIIIGKLQHIPLGIRFMMDMENL